MIRFSLYILGALLLLPLKAADSMALSLQDFRNEVFRPQNLPGSETGNVSAETKIIDILNFLINLILFASGSVAVLMLVYAGVRLITSGGDTQAKDDYIKIIRWSITGLLVVILAFAAVTNIIDLIYRATT